MDIYACFWRPAVLCFIAEFAALILIEFSIQESQFQKSPGGLVPPETKVM